MKFRITALLASTAALTLFAGAAFAQDATPPAAAAPAAAAPAPPVLSPSMTAPLAANSSPTSFDLGPLLGHKVYVTGALTGLAMTQNNRIGSDQTSQADISNAQIFINKADGFFQYFVDVGTYSLPALGTGYLKGSKITDATFGVVPLAYAKLQLTDAFSIQGGKLPTLIGAEYTYTISNTNIERGLLWGQEPVFSRGVQANYSSGPIAVSLSVNDGLYSNEFTSVSGAVTYTHDPANIVIFSASGNTKKSNVSTFATLPVQNDQQIYNLIYTHTMGQWSFTPYFQYTNIPAVPGAGWTKGTSTYGGALLASYTFDPKGMLAGFSLPFRFEYIGSSGNANDGSANALFYGAGSNAWSATITPTFQYKIYFIRGEVSYTQVGKATDGLAFGLDGEAKSQVRGLIETGVLF